jgi:hypothetical protein
VRNVLAPLAKYVKENNVKFYDDLLFICCESSIDVFNDGTIIGHLKTGMSIDNIILSISRKL